MTKKILYPIIIISCLICCLYFLKININKNDTNTENKIYVLSGVDRVGYLSLNNYNYKEIKKNIEATLNITKIDNDKIYAPICNKKEIAVFKNGKYNKKIDLTYSLPLMAKYNPFDKNAYVFHKTKVTYNNENCITIIDTKNDTEKFNIKYDKGIEDITFTEDNKMIVSSWTLDAEPVYTIDVFNLKDYSIIKTLKFPIMFNRIEAVSKDQIYAIDMYSTEPYIYVISLSKGKIIKKIKLPFKSPYNMCVNPINKQAYIIHLNFENCQSGKGLSIVDCVSHKNIGKMEKIYNPEGICINKDKLYISSYKDNKLYIVNNNIIIEKEIKIQRPFLPF